MYTKVRVLEKNTLCLSFFKNSLRFQPEIKRTGKQKKGIALLPDKQDRKIRKKFLVVIFQITLAGIPEKKELSPDGPYILHEQNSGVRLIRVNETGEIKDTVYKTIPADFSFPVVSEDGKHRFEVSYILLSVSLIKCLSRKN